jgi:hypothetical protein
MGSFLIAGGLMNKRWIAALAIALGSSGARAMDVGDGKLSVNGFGQWGYGRTAGANDYYIGTRRGEYDTAQFSLAVTARPADDVVVAGQFFVRSEGDVALDWGFVEYRLHDLLRIRAGKVKNPLGLFMEVKDVGTLRPFFALPQSIYGPGNIGTEAYLGAGVTGEWTAHTGWGVGYDVFGGALEMDVWEPSEAAIGVPPPFVFSDVAIEEEEVRDVVGGRLTLLTPVSGLTFRATSYTGRMREDDRDETERVTAFGLSAEYALDRFQIRGEIFRQNEGDAETNVGGYAEVAWKILPKLQAALRFEQARMTKEGLPASSPLRDHVEGAFGLSFWPRDNVAFKASYHHVEGNRLAVPAQSRPDGTFPRRTSLFVAGTQFSF